MLEYTPEQERELADMLFYFGLRASVKYWKDPENAADIAEKIYVKNVPPRIRELVEEKKEKIREGFERMLEER